MPIKIKLVALLILISGFANAADKKDAYKKAVDYCNCKIASTYCKQYSDMKPESEEKKSYDKIDYIFKCSITESLSYDSINNILKRNNFSAFSKKSSTVMSEILKEDVESLSTEDAVAKIISGIYESVEFKDFFLQYSEVGSLKESLKKEITDYLSQSFGASQSLINNDSNTDVTPKETELEKEVSRLETLIDSKTSSFSINWLSVILIVIVAILCFVLFFKALASLDKRIDKLTEKTDSHGRFIESKDGKTGSNQNFSQASQSNISDLKRFVEDKISEQNYSINKLQRDFDAFLSETNSRVELQQTHQQPNPQLEKHQKSEVFYASIPERDGSFNENAITNTLNPTASYYKFTVGKDSNIATFEFINDERAVKDAISSPDLILYPVCKIKSSQKQNAKRIKTPSHGTVIKRNNRWELGTKAEIEYE